MSSVFSAPHFYNETAAYEFVEAKLWPNGPVCPHCGGVERISKMGGKSTRIGAYKCYQCRKPFTVKIGTVFEASHVPMHHWLQAIHLMCASKKGISAHQMHRILEVKYDTAWFLLHRIRLAMASGDFTPMGGAGKFVEVDETYIGRLADVPKAKGGVAHKNAVLTLVERGGKARSFHVENASIAQIMPIVHANVAKESSLMTDEWAAYNRVGEAFAFHETVNHAKDEYVRGHAHTNTVEGFYSIFKRGMKGVYQHCAEHHLHRYLAEFDFRYSNRIAMGIDDGTRAVIALRSVKGKRLTYR